MCGIVVVAGKIGKEQREVFRQMLIVGSLRGPHSTGFFSAKGNNSEVFKLAGDPFTVMEHKGFDRLLNKDTNVLVGHNRFATVGKINRQNAHPFDFPNVVGVHNGTLTNKYQLPDGHQFDVDSEALYNGFDTIGPAQTIAKTRGAWSLVWWDKQAKTLNFLRNNERPMAYCFSEDKKTLYAASEGHMLLWILTRNGVKHTPINVTNVNNHYSLHIKESTEFAAQPLPDPVVAELLGAPAEVFQFGRTGTAVNTNTGNKTAIYSYSNTLVEFVPDRAQTIDGTRYVEGSFWNNEGEEFNILVEVTADPALENFLMTNDPDAGYLTYTGVAYGSRYLNGEQYLIIRGPSIKGKETLKKREAPKEAPPQWPGYKGKALSMVQWRDFTACGCDYCGHIPIEEEKNSLLWLTHVSFRCDRCVKELESV